MRNGFWRSTALLVCLASFATAQERLDGEEAPRATAGGQRPGVLRVRYFEFTYAGVLTDLPAGQTAKIWLPVPQEDVDQKIKQVAAKLPGPARQTREPVYGNAFLFVEAEVGPSGELPLEVRYLVQRREVRRDSLQPVPAETLKTFQVGSPLVPIDPALRSLLVGEGVVLPTNQEELARVLYKAVGDRLRYDKPEGGRWGRGDAAWACDSGFGNCTDFHSLFLSACRTSGIPGKFEMGFPIGSAKQGEVGGYHCWARFRAQDRWIPVDISAGDKQPEKREYFFGNLTEDRVLFSTGRNFALSPPAATGKVNYLIYPHVEVAGQVYRGFKKAFRYREVTTKRL